MSWGYTFCLADLRHLATHWSKVLIKAPITRNSTKEDLFKFLDYPGILSALFLLSSTSVLKN